jgi:uncharacterized protein
MIISIKDLLRGFRHFDFAFDSDWWMDRDANQILGLDGPINVQMTISKEERNFMVEGHLSGSVKIRCDRCLGSYSHELEPEFRLLLSSPAQDTDQNEIELCKNDMTIRFISGDEIDIDDIVMEQIYLSLPIKFLCGQRCHGLCPTCGTNLNKEKCGCREKDGHPAFLKLKELEIDRR